MISKEYIHEWYVYKRKTYLLQLQFDHTCGNQFKCDKWIDMYNVILSICMNKFNYKIIAYEAIKQLKKLSCNII